MRRRPRRPGALVPGNCRRRTRPACRTGALRDLGSHRLNDLGGPENLFQLDLDDLTVEFPPLRTLDHPDLLHNCRSCVELRGTDAEMAEVGRLVGDRRLKWPSPVREGGQDPAGIAGGR